MLIYMQSDKKLADSWLRMYRLKSRLDNDHSTVQLLCIGNPIIHAALTNQTYQLNLQITSY